MSCLRTQVPGRVFSWCCTSSEECILSVAVLHSRRQNTRFCKSLVGIWTMGIVASCRHLRGKTIGPNETMENASTYDRVTELANEQPSGPSTGGRPTQWCHIDVQRLLNIKNSKTKINTIPWLHLIKPTTVLYASFLKGQEHQGISSLVRGTLLGNCKFLTWALQGHQGNDQGAWRHGGNRLCCLSEVFGLQLRFLC